MKSSIFILISISILLKKNFTLATEEEEEEEVVPPALTCVVLGDAACQRMCTMLGRIYAAPSNPARCDAANNCQCSMVQHNYLDDLWRDKFKSVEFLDTVKNNDLHKDIVEIMKIPYQTREQTKHMLESFFPAANFAKIQVNDNITENMIKKNADGKQVLDRETIRSFVSQNLQTESLSLPEDFDYKVRFRNSLENTSNEDMVQYIIHDVRQSKNPILNEIVDEFLKERNIKEESYDDEDDDESFTDILDLDIVNEYINPTLSTKDHNSDVDPTLWDLPDLDVPSVEQFHKGYQCWTDNKTYNVCLLIADWGDINLTWVKGDENVNINVDIDTGDVTQTWKLDQGVEISLSKSSDGNVSQTWKFAPNSKLDYLRFGEVRSEKWLNDVSNDAALAKYKSVIDSWCDKNSIFIERVYCVIY